MYKNYKINYNNIISIGGTSIVKNEFPYGFHYNNSAKLYYLWDRESGNYINAQTREIVNDNESLTWSISQLDNDTIDHINNNINILRNFIDNANIINNIKKCNKNYNSHIITGPPQYQNACWLHSALVALFLTDAAKETVKKFIRNDQIFNVLNGCMDLRLNKKRYIIQSYAYILLILINSFLNYNTSRYQPLDPRHRPQLLRRNSADRSSNIRLQRINQYSYVSSVPPLINQIIKCMGKTDHHYIKTIIFKENRFNTRAPGQIASKFLTETNLSNNRGIVVISLDGPNYREIINYNSQDKARIRSYILFDLFGGRLLEMNDYIKENWVLGSITLLIRSHITTLIKYNGKEYHYNNEITSDPGEFTKVKIIEKDWFDVISSNINVIKTIQVFYFNKNNVEF
jgi:hypothetical protein